MFECQSPGMQPIAGIARQAGLVGSRLPAGSVEWVACERMADEGEMDANLVRTTGQQIDLKNSGVHTALQRASNASRGLAGFACRMHLA
jgi:hypothetical protein